MAAAARSSRSAGIVLFRRGAAGIEVLLGHLGGPLWANKDDGAWSIPKGEYEENELPLEAARREFAEELGSPAPAGNYLALGEIVQRNRKIVTAWAVEGDLDADSIVSNLFELQWPPRSGRTQSFPETDRAAWFDLDTARRKVVGGQAAVFDLLENALRE